MKRVIIPKKERLSGSSGMMIIYQNYAKSEYIVMAAMHTHGLKNFVSVLVGFFLLMNIKQSYRKMNQTPT